MSALLPLREGISIRKALEDAAATGRANGDPRTRGQLMADTLFTHPDTGRLNQLETTRRCFEGPLRRMLVVRDEICRTPYCDAPIKHIDHVTPVEHGGPTSERNGQGLCEHCNYIKNLPGWTSRADPVGGAGVAVRITTPTGHTYTSTPPPLPGAPPPRADADIGEPWRLVLHRHHLPGATAA